MLSLLELSAKAVIDSVSLDGIAAERVVELREVLESTNLPLVHAALVDAVDISLRLTAAHCGSDEVRFDDCGLGRSGTVLPLVAGASWGAEEEVQMVPCPYHLMAGGQSDNLADEMVVVHGLQKNTALNGTVGRTRGRLSGERYRVALESEAGKVSLEGRDARPQREATKRVRPENLRLAYLHALRGQAVVVFPPGFRGLSPPEAGGFAGFGEAFATSLERSGARCVVVARSVEADWRPGSLPVPVIVVNDHHFPKMIPVLGNFVNGVAVPAQCTACDSHPSTRGYHGGQLDTDFAVQEWFYCLTCCPRRGGVGVCGSCARRCHRGHRLEYARRTNFACDCQDLTHGGCQCVVPEPPPLPGTTSTEDTLRACTHTNTHMRIHTYDIGPSEIRKINGGDEPGQVVESMMAANMRRKYSKMFQDGTISEAEYAAFACKLEEHQTLRLREDLRLGVAQQHASQMSPRRPWRAALHWSTRTTQAEQVGLSDAWGRPKDDTAGIERLRAKFLALDDSLLLPDLSAKLAGCASHFDETSCLYNGLSNEFFGMCTVSRKAFFDVVSQHFAELRFPLSTGLEKVSDFDPPALSNGLFLVDGRFSDGRWMGSRVLSELRAREFGLQGPLCLFELVHFVAPHRWSTAFLPSAPFLCGGAEGYVAWETRNRAEAILADLAAAPGVDANPASDEQDWSVVQPWGGREGYFDALRASAALSVSEAIERGDVFAAALIVMARLILRRIRTVCRGPRHRCGFCGLARGEGGVKLLRCACGDVYYCARLCQKLDWAAHKALCSRLRREKKNDAKGVALAAASH